MSSPDLGPIFKDACTHRFQHEFMPRILKCLDELSDDKIWHRPNPETTSIGNLILHLCGNVTQWVISTLGGEPDNRERQKEFDAEGPIPVAQLKDQLIQTVNRACEVISGLDDATLTTVHVVQDSEDSGIGIIIQVTEHFSYHTGQIALHTKLRKNIDLEFYKDYDLEATGSVA